MAQRQIKLFSWNVNGIRAVEKKGFLTWLDGCGADVVALQETKASPEQLSAALREPPGFVPVQVRIGHHRRPLQQREAGIEISCGVPAGADHAQSGAHFRLRLQNASICATIAVSVGRRSMELAP